VNSLQTLLLLVNIYNKHSHVVLYVCKPFVRFQGLTMTTTKIIVFWDIALCSLLESNRRFGVAYCLHHQGDEYAMGGIGS
jgi:hypothetical protein